MIPKIDKHLEDAFLSLSSWIPNAPMYRVALFGDDPNVAYRIVELTDMTEYLELQSMLAQLGFISSDADSRFTEANLDACFYLSGEKSQFISQALRCVA
ncbi:hypothetical protein CS022_08255 [Veronia nyctiphanis]|uniref:Uncharacterized protein n=1 Tax=Veronia nyctiphanis TaxID=1278244 RepID=A0A4Q0YSP7_9GAMM|nr:hypothetical protein [Veronia nyctiphanis]RXJ73715.1 hypothetical protein CS022_08255 [Veronia nyctiphanis]